MLRYLKMLGLVALAAFAMSGVAASAASAETAVVTGGPDILGHDTEEALNALTGNANVECENATYPGTAEGSTITVGLEFSDCAASSGAPVTIEDNECHYTLTMGALSGHTAPATAALVCPSGQMVNVRLYSGVPHTTNICTVEIPPQGGLTGLNVTDQTNGHLRVQGTAEGITNYVTGGCLGGATLNLGDADLHADMTITGGVGLETQSE